MGDIRAVGQLRERIDCLLKLPNPPEDDVGMDEHDKALKQEMQKASATVDEVKLYVDVINEHIKELKEAFTDMTTKIRTAIEKIFEQLQAFVAETNDGTIDGSQNSTPGGGHSSGSQGQATANGAPIPSSSTSTKSTKTSKKNTGKSNLQILQNAHRLEQMAKSAMDDRLIELITETETVIAKVKDDADLTEGDIDNLKGYLDSWKAAKVESYETEKKLRKDREQQEKERQRKEKEQKQKDEQSRKKREEEARARRLDPNNWTPLVYQLDGEVPGRRPWNQEGVTCIVTSPDELKIDDMTVTAGESLEKVQNEDMLGDGERLVSEMVDVRSNCGTIKSETPTRFYVPYGMIEHQVREEIVIKHSRDGKVWSASAPLKPTENVTSSGMLDNKQAKLAGLELNNFENVQIAVVVRPRGQSISVTAREMTVTSKIDDRVNLFISELNYKTKTDISFVVNKVKGDVLSREMSTTPLVTVVCASEPANSITVDINVAKHGIPRPWKGKFVGCFTDYEGNWKALDPDRWSDERVLVRIPPRSKSFSVIGLQGPPDMTAEHHIKEARWVYDTVYKTPVQALLRQSAIDPTDAVVVVDRAVNMKGREQELVNQGYTDGPAMSGVHYFKDGQKLHLSSSGKIDLVIDSPDELKLTFYAYVRPVWKRLKLKPLDADDKDEDFVPMSSRFSGIYRPQAKASKAVSRTPLPDRMGHVRIIVEDGTEFPEEYIKLTATLHQSQAKRK